MGVTATAPLLLLLIPLLVAVVVGLQLLAHGHLGDARARLALLVRSALMAALVAALAGVAVVLPADRLATVFVVDLSDSVGNDGPGRGPRLRPGSARGASRRRRRRGRRLRQGCPRGAPAGRARRARPDRLDAGPRGDRHRGRAAPGRGPLPRRDAAADRPPLGRQRHDRHGPGGSRPRRSPRHPGDDPDDRPRRHRRGARRADLRSDDLAAGRGARGRRRGRLDSRPAGHDPALRRRRPRGDRADDARRRRDAGRLPGIAAGGRLPRLPGGRRSGGGHVPPEQPGRRRDARLRAAARARRAGRRGRGRRPRRRPRDARGRGRDDPPGARPRRSRHALRLRQHRPRRRAAHPLHRPPARGAALRHPRLREGPRHGRRLPQLRRRRLPRHPAGGRAPGRDAGPGPREAARRRARRRHRPVGLDGRLPLQHVQSRPGRPAHRRSQGRHRQGGDPAGRRRPAGDRRARRRRLQRAGELDRPAHAAGLRHRPPGPARRHRGRRPDEHLRRRRGGREGARGGEGDPSSPHPPDRRLVELGAVRRDPGPHEGGRHHPLDGRRWGRVEPLPAGPRHPRRRPLLRRGQPGRHPRHLPQGDAAGLRPADRGGAVLPGDHRLVADHPRARRRVPGTPRLQRDHDQGGRDPGPRLRSIGPGARPVAVRSRAGRGVDVGRDGALGPQLGRPGTGSPASSASWSPGRSPARSRAGSRPVS